VISPKIYTLSLFSNLVFYLVASQTSDHTKGVNFSTMGWKAELT